MLKDIAPKGGTGTVERARSLRSTMSLPEVLLWRALRGQPKRLKFRRQHPSGAYIIDFYCNDARLAVEIDGEAHARGDRPVRDEARDRWFAGRGIVTLRLPASAVLEDVGNIVEHILSIATARLPLHRPAAPGGPPPRDKLGED